MLKTKEILIVIGSLDVGGTEVHLLRTLPELKRRGYEIAVWILSHRGCLAARMEENGVVVLPKGAPMSRNKSRSIRLIRIAKSSLQLFTKLSVKRFSLVHAFLPSSYLIVGLMTFFLPQVEVVMSRRSLNEYQEKNKIFKHLEMFLHNNTIEFLCNTKRIKDELIKEGVKKEKIKVIYNGVPIFIPQTETEKDASRAAYKIPSSCVTITMIANLIPYKGHKDLILAMRHVSDALKIPWKLLLIGRDDGIKSELETLCKSCGIYDSVSFIAGKSCVKDILSISDIAVLCSHQEGFSNSILEAMSAGVPVIATDVGGNSEAITHKHDGLLVPPMDPHSLSVAIQKLICDVQLRKQLGAAARATATNSFTQQACVDGYSRFYDSLCNYANANIYNRRDK